MRFSTISAVLTLCSTGLASSSSKLSSSTAAAAASSTALGYDNFPSSIPSTVTANNLTFGQHYAVLNLDLINFIVGGFNTTAPGQTFIKSVSTWIDAVHKVNPNPLTIFTRIYYSNARKPEITPNVPFAARGGALGVASDPSTQIYPAFHVNETAGDVVLQKTRFYAGAGNGLEEILSTQGIDTVIMSGVSTSGVILSTAYRLFDLNYKIYVIANNTIEPPPNAEMINDAILEGILPKFNIGVITLDQALAALARSGPAVY